jgi:hypothetical protein
MATRSIRKSEEFLQEYRNRNRERPGGLKERLFLSQQRQTGFGRQYARARRRDDLLRLFGVWASGKKPLHSLALLVDALDAEQSAALCCPVAAQRERSQIHARVAQGEVDVRERCFRHDSSPWSIAFSH